ncbi:piggyBac transposable element-derived protein 3-like [Pieris brassicae]|uniref:piggyBac transposable element-derived protein 3-like n=1 Tax=Pieris brassicae TaxID=7116 RepID=UPI001E660B9D|nr:piggyBac transposable element-derived protein 3-like [Pieris brassicae]
MNNRQNAPHRFMNLVTAGVSGIIYDFFLYAGDDITFTEEEETMDVGSKIVLALSKTIQNKASVVTLVSSFDDAYPVENIKRFRKEAKSRVDGKCPKIVKDYNRHMGGVDLADMLIALYRTGI